MLEVTETEACEENGKQNDLGKGAIYFHTKARKGRGKIPPPTPDYDINYERSLKGLPEIYPEEIDDVPEVSENGIRFCIEYLGEKLGCGDYEYDLIQFWFLDILTDCLWKAQDYFSFEEREQKIILEWAVAFFKIIADPVLNISRKSFLNFFKQVLLKMYREINKTCVFPSIGVMSEFLEVASVIEQINGEQDETKTSTTTSASNPSGSTFTIHSRDKFKVSPDFDIKQHIKNLKSNNPLSNLYHAVSETQSSVNFEDLSEEEGNNEDNQDDTFIFHYSSVSFTKNNFDEHLTMDLPNFSNARTCYCKKHKSFFCTCIKTYPEEDVGEEDYLDYQNIDELYMREEIREIMEYLLDSTQKNQGNKLLPSLSGEELVLPLEEIVEIKKYEPKEKPKKTSNGLKGRNKVSIEKNQKLFIKKTSKTFEEEQSTLNKTKRSSTSLKHELSSKQNIHLEVSSKPKKSSSQIKTIQPPPLKKPVEIKFEDDDLMDEEDLEKEKELLMEWAQFKLLEQRNIDMDNPKKGWVPWSKEEDPAIRSVDSKIDNPIISTEDFVETSSYDSVMSEQKSFNFKILRAIIDFVFEYFYENFHFTLIQLAFRSTPNVLSQKLNKIWNVPKTLKQEIKRPKPTKKKKEKSRKSSKSRKSKKSKKSKKGSDKKSKKSDKKSKKGKGGKDKKKKKKKEKMSKAEKERLKREQQLLEEERRRLAENKLFMFPLADAASEDLFMSIFENWVRVASEKGKKKKKGKGDAKKKKK